MRLPRSPLRSLVRALQPAPAWSAILGFALMLALCFAAGAGRVLVLVFPVSALAVGLFLYLQYPPLYTGFTLWMWFLGPLVRRLIDYQSGYATAGPWTLAPLLVTSISVITLIRALPKVHKQGGLPFLLSICSVLYGFSIELIYHSISDVVAIHLMSWLSPLLFGFHLFARWRDYPRERSIIQTAFVWGVLVMGAYGIYQYLVAPEWDRFWMGIVENSTFGDPEPLKIRVWSTMMIPQKFAAFMMAGLLVLFTVQGSLRFVSAGAGYLAFLLTLARAGWLTWLAGLLLFIPSLKSNLQMRLIITLMLGTLLVFPLTTIEPFSDAISSRVESFSNAGQDDSYEARLEGSVELLDTILLEFRGRGLGSKLQSDEAGGGVSLGYDNGLFVFLVALGWFGTIAYMAGVILILFQLFQGPESRFDLFASAARAIALSNFLVQTGLNPTSEGEFAIVLWSFLGMGMAARKYYASLPAFSDPATSRIAPSGYRPSS